MDLTSLFSQIIFFSSISSFAVASKYVHTIQELEESSQILRRPPDDICSSFTSTVIVVKSAVSHFEKRNIIRKTWGRQSDLIGIPVVFILGQTMDSSAKVLEDEIELYNDIIVGNFIDTYYNLTLKSFSALSWAKLFCSKVKWFFFSDDDIILQPIALKDMMLHTPMDPESFHCRVWFAVKVRRNPVDRFYVPIEDIPLAKYPKYCPGFAYFVPGRKIDRLVSTVLSPNSSLSLTFDETRVNFPLPRIKFEDAFITGIARHAAGIDIQNLPQSTQMFRENINWKYISRSDAESIIAAGQTNSLLHDIEKFNTIRWSHGLNHFFRPITLYCMTGLVIITFLLLFFLKKLPYKCMIRKMSGYKLLPR